jgi:predicted ester cyclase
MMENTEIVREIYSEGFSGGRFEILDLYLKEDYVNHNLPLNATSGLGGLKETMRRLRVAFPDLTYKVEDAFGEKDRVAVRATMSGTDIGGFGGRKPSGKYFEVTSLAIVRLENGKVVERWGLHDIELMAAQLEAQT